MYINPHPPSIYNGHNFGQSIKMRSVDYRRKGRQWSFTIPSFTMTTINRLSNLNPDEFNYIAFAILDDDTGNQYIEGYIKIPTRCREGTVRKLIGASFLRTCKKVCTALAEIHLNKSLVEFGVLNDQTKQFRDELVSFKDAVQLGYNREKLLEISPRLHAEFPLPVVKYLNKNPTPVRADDNPEWVSVGCPSGLPWTVYQAWKKGEMYSSPRKPERIYPSHFTPDIIWRLEKEEIESSTDFTGVPGSLAYKVYQAWTKGYLFELI
jgi:hypothetical protein